ncbi:MAG: NAD(P)H-hydrate dehydratase [Flavobacteriaceae bacterium]
MVILTAEQLYKAHENTIHNQEISELDLIERAGLQVFNWIHTRMQGSQVKIHVLNGIGNNGAVGLSLAKHLIINGYNIDNYVVNFSKKRTPAFLENYDKVKALKSWPTLINHQDDFPKNIGADDIIIDAIFGIGLNKDTGGLVNNLFTYLNTLSTFKLAIDIPSGLHANKAIDLNHVLKVNYTLTFQSPKLVFFLPETAVFTEQWEVLDIGLEVPVVETAPQLISKHEVLPLYRMREKFSNKFSYGHALIVGGSFGKMGSVTLSSQAALKTGCGLITAYTPSCGVDILQCAFPEAMVQIGNGERVIENICPEGHFNAIGIGVGMGLEDVTAEGLQSFLKENTAPLVIDADGINLLARHNQLLQLLPKQTVLTPHKKELERLIGVWKNDFDMLEQVKSFSLKHDCIIVLKDAITITVYKNDLFINTSGNPALATAGSGDVLTGILTSLIAQGYTSLHAAVMGVYLHGSTADIAVEQTGYQSFTASDCVSNLGQAYLNLFKQPESPTPDQ